MFGACKICAEKDVRIEDLKKQIEDLRQLVFPKNTQEISAKEQEVDGIFSGEIPVIEMTNEQVEGEAHALLSGSYDNSQIEI